MPLTLLEKDGEAASFAATLKTEKSTWTVIVRFSDAAEVLRLNISLTGMKNISLLKRNLSVMCSQERRSAILPQASLSGILIKTHLGSRLVLRCASISGVTFLKQTAA